VGTARVAYAFVAMRSARTDRAYDRQEQ